MGLRSGEYGGRYQSPAPAALMMRRSAADLWLPRAVPDDDVALPEDGNELLLDIGIEALAVDRAIEDARSREAVAAQRAEEGQGAPVAMRRQTA